MVHIPLKFFIFALYLVADWTLFKYNLLLLFIIYVKFLDPMLNVKIILGTENSFSNLTTEIFVIVLWPEDFMEIEFWSAPTRIFHMLTLVFSRKM